MSARGIALSAAATAATRLTCFAQGPVLGRGRLAITVGTGASVSKLHLGGEHVRAGTNAPGHKRLGDAARLDGLADLILLNASHLAQKHQHFHLEGAGTHG